MKKISVLLIVLFALMVSNNVNAQKDPLVPHLTYFNFQKTIMESGVDLNTSTLTIHLVADYANEWGGVDFWWSMPATTSTWTEGHLLSEGWAEIWISGNAWAHYLVHDFAGSPLIIPVPLNVYMLNLKKIDMSNT